MEICSMFASIYSSVSPEVETIATCSHLPANTTGYFRAGLIFLHHAPCDPRKGIHSPPVPTSTRPGYPPHPSGYPPILPSGTGDKRPWMVYIPSLGPWVRFPGIPFPRIAREIRIDRTRPIPPVLPALREKFPSIP